MRRIVILILLLAGSLLADVVFSLSHLSAEQNMVGYMDYIEDENSSLTYEHIRSIDGMKSLKKSNLGSSIHNAWTKLQIKNDTQKEQKLILYNVRPGVDMLDVYVIQDDNKTVNRYLLGSLVTGDDKPLQFRQSAFDIDLQSSKTITIITKVSTTGVLEAGWIVSTISNFSKKTTIDSIVFGAFGGLIISLIVYSLSLFAVLKYRVILVYIGFTASVLFYQFLVAGVIHGLDLFATDVLNALKFSLGSMLVTFYLLFCIFYFETKVNTPKIHTLLKTLTITFFILTPINYLSFKYGFFSIVGALSNLLALVTFCLLFIVALYMYYKKSAGANYYLAGQIFWILSSMYQMSTILGIFETSSLSVYATVIGMSIDSLFLSLAINKKVQQLKQELEKNNKMMLVMSRFASIGQVVGNISHQWKIPLVRMGMLITELEVKNSFKTVQKDDLDVVLPHMKETLTFMNDTINEFQEFYNTNKDKSFFQISKQVNDIKEMISGKLLASDCTLEIYCEGEKEFFGYQHSLAHIFMIIIDNSIEVAKSRNVCKAVITVKITSSDKAISVEISDNCGGIEQEPIEKIFDFFESSKKESNSGLGLAIAQKILVEKMNGEITVKNINNGALFTIVLPNSDKHSRHS